MLLVQEGENTTDDYDELVEEPLVEVAKMVELSLNSVIGLTTLETMKI